MCHVCRVESPSRICTPWSLPSWHLQVPQRLWGSITFLFSTCIQEPQLNIFVRNRNAIGPSLITWGNNPILLPVCAPFWSIGLLRSLRNTRFTTRRFSSPFRSLTGFYRTCQFCAANCSWWELPPCSSLRKSISFSSFFWYWILMGLFCKQQIRRDLSSRGCRVRVHHRWHVHQEAGLAYGALDSESSRFRTCRADLSLLPPAFRSAYSFLRDYSSLVFGNFFTRPTISMVANLS